MMDIEQFNQGVDFLERKGINLVAVFALDDLPDELCSSIKALGVDIKDYQRLVLLGHAGKSFWSVLKNEDKSLFDREAPIDLFSHQVVEQTVRSYWGDVLIEALYPGDSSIPLQQLGKMAGWHHKSPMGVGINEEYGLWFAYRALFLIDAPLPLRRKPSGISPCENCLDKFCITACPAAALDCSKDPEINRCSQFRVKKDSPCQDRCLARESCPVALDQRYSREQISYHYLQSLRVVQAYFP